MGYKLPHVPSVLRRDVRRTLRVVFSRPSRLRRLIALGPRGWLATARFLTAVIPRAGRELALIRTRASALWISQGMSHRTHGHRMRRSHKTGESTETQQ